MGQFALGKKTLLPQEIHHKLIQNLIILMTCALNTCSELLISNSNYSNFQTENVLMNFEKYTPEPVVKSRI